MMQICIFVDSHNPFNSIYLQSRLLVETITRELGICPVFISKRDLGPCLKRKDCIVLVPYGCFDFNLCFRKSLDNVVLIYHNITPAHFFWKSEFWVSIKSILGRMQLRFLKNRVKNVVAVSLFNKCELEKMGFQDVHLCPNILVPSCTNNVVKTSIPSLLYVGRIVQNKDCVSLLGIVEQVSLHYKKMLELYIVGSGKPTSKYYKQFVCRVSQLRENKNIRIIWKEKIDNVELEEIYKKCWLYLSLSKHEGFGLPVCESINYGTPALYTSCGGQETVLNNEGMVAVDDMAFVVNELLCSEIERNSLLQRQYVQVLQYLPPKIDETVNNVYGKIIYGKEVQ